MFWRLALGTCFNREKCVFCISKTVFKTFSVFPSTFCDCSLSSPFLSQLKLTQTLYFCIISSQIFKKMYGFSLSHFIFHVLSLLFLFLWVYWGHYDFVKCHTHSRVSFILVIVHCLRVSVFDFVTDVCMMSGVCALFHDNGCFIHIMYMVFCHIICHLNPCNAQCPLDSKLLMFITIFDCLFHLLCPYCLWLLVFNLILVFVIEWNLPISHSYT